MTKREPSAGVLSTAVAEALRLARAMRADGATDAERHRVIESVLREHWPRGREWRYLCERCRDTGLELRYDVVNRLGVTTDEGTACLCPKGARFRAQAPAEADYTQAGKVKKPARSWSKFGDGR